MNILLDKEMRDSIARSDFCYQPNHRVITFPRFLLDQLLEIERDKHHKIIRYRKGLSKDTFRLICWMLAMRIEIELDDEKIAFIYADSKSQLAGLVGLSIRNTQYIIKRLEKEKIIEERRIRHCGETIKGYILCNYHEAFIKGSSGFFKLPSYIFEEKFWTRSKPAIKLCFAELSELQAHKAFSGKNVKVKTNRDIKKILHYKSFTKQQNILGEIKEYIDHFELSDAKNCVASWVFNIKNSLDNILDQHQKAEKYIPKMSKVIQDAVAEQLDQFHIPHTEKDFNDYRNILKKYGLTIFKLGIRILVSTWDHIKTTPVQKLWGICKNIVSESLSQTALKKQYMIDQDLVPGLSVF